MIRVLLILAIGNIILAKGETSMNQSNTRKIYRSQADQIKLNQKGMKKQIGIQNTSYQSYNFVLNKKAQFIVKEEDNQEMKVVVDVLWKEKNIYVQASVLKEQQISLAIEDQNKTYVASKTFFTGTGFIFKIASGKSYKLILKQSGNYRKIIMIHMSKPYKPSNITAKLKQMVVLQSNLLVIQQKLTYMFVYTEQFEISIHWVFNTVKDQSGNTEADLFLLPIRSNRSAVYYFCYLSTGKNSDEIIKN